MFSLDSTLISVLSAAVAALGTTVAAVLASRRARMRFRMELDRSLALAKLKSDDDGRTAELNERTSFRSEMRNDIAGLRHECDALRVRLRQAEDDRFNCMRERQNDLLMWKGALDKQFELAQALQAGQTRIADAVSENTRLTIAALERADSAFKEANSMNTKLVSLGIERRTK